MRKPKIEPFAGAKVDKYRCPKCKTEDTPMMAVTMLLVCSNCGHICGDELFEDKQ